MRLADMSQKGGFDFLGYYVEGQTVGDETQRVAAGDCVFIPTGQPHGLLNDGAASLRYFSAAAPAYPPGHLEKT